MMLVHERHIEQDAPRARSGTKQDRLEPLGNAQVKRIAQLRAKRGRFFETTSRQEVRYALLFEPAATMPIRERGEFVGAAQRAPSVVESLLFCQKDRQLHFDVGAVHAFRRPLEQVDCFVVSTLQRKQMRQRLDGAAIVGIKRQRFACYFDGFVEAVLRGQPIGLFYTDPWVFRSEGSRLFEKMFGRSEVA
jgi:hypothetical protein